MKSYSDLLYWVKYRELIHYDEKTNTYHYDSELPEKARKSFEEWLNQNAYGDDKRKQLLQ